MNIERLKYMNYWNFPGKGKGCPPLAVVNEYDVAYHFATTF